MDGMFFSFQCCWYLLMMVQPCSEGVRSHVSPDSAKPHARRMAPVPGTGCDGGGAWCG
jgi:hypothetical protein